MRYITPRSVAEELDMELQALAHEMAEALRSNPVDNATHSAIHREFRGQRASAIRLRRLFTDTALVA
jgi:hypothetical protein